MKGVIFIPASEALLRAIRKYDDKAYEKFLIRVRKGELDPIRQAAAANGESLNAFVVNAVRDKIARIEKEKAAR